ncbi:universal stress protein [Streptomyces sp. NPDC014882]|uniref:universal stress protein n=1 Tax=Streptomyces sp. NPDC014882 TaxID=3364927 RepID=UPI0036FC63C2
MSRTVAAGTVTVGLDGSRESRAAAEWAAGEAQLRALPLRLVQVWEPLPEPMAQAPLPDAETGRHQAGRIPRETAGELRLSHPGLDVRTEQLPGGPAEVLCRAAAEAELLVLGSRGMSGIGGFLVGSVGLAVVAHAERPVVLVRTPGTADGHGTGDAHGPVVLGLDTGRPSEELIEFALTEAARRGAAVRVVHGWSPKPSYAYALSVDPGFHETLAQYESTALNELLHPWREKFPDLEIVAESRYGSPAAQLVEASRDARLVVVGRRTRRGPGAHVGHVTHAVLHHCTAPVAVVPHD